MAVAVDGRHRRREENREAVIDALVALWREGEYQPSAAEIAQRAGLSPRSLFRYFADIDDLSRAAVEHHLTANEALFTVDTAPDEPTDVKVTAIVAGRLRLYDAIEPGARAGRIAAHRNPVVASHLRGARAFFRNQVAELFAPELGDRPHVLQAIDVLLSFESRELLDLTTARAVLIAVLTSLLKEAP